MSFFPIRPVTPADAATWERLRTAHWPDGAADHAPEIAAFFAGTGLDPEPSSSPSTTGKSLP